MSAEKIVGQQKELEQSVTIQALTTLLRAKCSDAEWNGLREKYEQLADSILITREQHNELLAIIDNLCFDLAYAHLRREGIELGDPRIRVHADAIKEAVMKRGKDWNRNK